MKRAAGRALVDALEASADAARTQAPLALSTAAVLALYWLLEPAVFATARLGPEVYRDGHIVLSALVASPLFLGGWLLSVALGFQRTRWSQLEPAERLLMWPVACAVGALVWHLGTLEANFFYGHAYGADRLILLATGLAVLRWPAALPAFLVTAQAVTGQLHVEPLRFNWSDTRALYQVLTGVTAWFLLRSLAARLRAPGQRKSPSLEAGAPWIVAFGLLGSWYFLAAWGKLHLGWLTRNDLSQIVAATYLQHGWLGWMEPAAHARFVSVLRTLSLPMQAGALFVEGVVIGYLASRRGAIAIVCLGIGLHLVIFAVTGIFFWKWTLLEVGLVIAALRFGEARWRRTLPRSASTLLCLGVILLSARFGPQVTKLAWFDAPLVYRFHFEAIAADGDRYEATPDSFAPFDSRFAQGRWYPLTDAPRLVNSFGATADPRVLEALRAADSPDAVRAVVTRFGRPAGSDVERAAFRGRFETFAVRFLDATHTPPAASPPAWLHALSRLRAPHHIWSGQPHGATLEPYEGQEPLIALEATLVEWWDRPSGPVEIRRQPILRIERPAS